MTWMSMDDFPGFPETLLAHFARGPAAGAVGGLGDGVEGGWMGGRPGVGV